MKAKIIVAAALLLVSLYQPAEAKGIGPTGAAIVGGLAGVAVGAAIADAARPARPKYYYDGYAPPYRPGNYDPYFNQAFSPSAGVVCYPAQRMCYDNNGTVSHKWTRRVYGY